MIFFRRNRTMPITVVCECGRNLTTRDENAGKRANCPTCGNVVQVPETSASSTEEPKPSADAPLGPAPMPLTEFLDPPAEPLEQIQEDSVLKKMFEALLDPRSIQWMLMLGGGLLVLGLVVLLINWLDIEAPYIIAASMGAGTLAIMAGGWYFALKTKYKIAGRALTFLTCVVAPLNLWYYHAQDILTLENHLWVGGVICSLLYIATVRVLRDPIFMYAVAVGVTLTVLLFLPVLNVSVDATNLSITLMILGLVAVHAERAFTACRCFGLDRLKRVRRCSFCCHRNC
jgi:hypothetical protein